MGLAALLVAPAAGQDFAAGPLEPAASLVSAAHSTVAPVSPTEEQFNGDVAHVEVAEIRDSSIAAALSANDVFGVAEGGGSPQAADGVSAAAALAEGPERLRDDVAGLSIDNALAGPSIRMLMAAPALLMPWDDTGGPIALNAAAE
ncbi:MAG: hypothetical protein AB7O49_14140 [Sphingomonadales bacterium]